jgi:hypothetical protein
VRRLVAWSVQAGRVAAKGAAAKGAAAKVPWRAAPAAGWGAAAWVVLRVGGATVKVAATAGVVSAAVREAAAKAPCPEVKAAG